MMETGIGTGCREPVAREQRHKAVANFGQFALEGPTLQQLLDRAVQEVSRCLDARFVKFLELTPDREGLKLRSGIGWRPGLVGQAIVPTDIRSQAGFTLLSERPVIVRDVSTETRFEPPELLSDHGIRCGVSVIVGPVGDPWGVVGVHESELGRCGFDEDDVDFIRSVANIVWLFIRNLRSTR
jgi:GAF domain-containing protein